MTARPETLIDGLRIRAADWRREGLPMLSACLARAADTLVTLETQNHKLAALLTECDSALSTASPSCDLLHRIHAVCLPRYYPSRYPFGCPVWTRQGHWRRCLGASVPSWCVPLGGVARLAHGEPPVSATSPGIGR